MEKITKIGKRGTIVIPIQLRKKLGLEEGDVMVIEQTDQGMLLRPAQAVPVESYSDRRKAEFILSNAVDPEDYQRARNEVEQMGLDPDDIPHYSPSS